MAITFSLWAYLKIKEGRRPEVQPEGEQISRRRKAGGIVPTWAWMAVIIIIATVAGDIFITRRNQERLLANAALTPEAGEAGQPEVPAPAEVGTPFSVTAAFQQLCFLPAVNAAQDPADVYTWRAVQLAAAQYGAGAEYVDPGTPDEAGYNTAIAQLIGDKCDLIVGNYSPQGQAIMKQAAGYPDQNFMLLGGGSDIPNVWVSKYSLPEQAYLAGYLAAAASTSGKVGTFGSQQIPDIVPGMNCFVSGVNEYNIEKLADVSVLGWDSEKQLGLYADDPRNQDQETSLANQLISQGADVIFPMARSGLSSNAAGIITAARQRAGVYVIGVDLDWAWALPEYANGIISSAVTRQEQSIALAAEAVAGGEFHGGVHAGNLATGEIGFAPLRASPGWFHRTSMPPWRKSPTRFPLRMEKGVPISTGFPWTMRWTEPTGPAIPG